MSTKGFDNFDSNKKLYSFEDQEFKFAENQESINLGIIKEDNALNANAPSPIQNNTMQELDSEFLKEYEDAISDRDKKIAELMHEIEKIKKDNPNNENSMKEAKQKIKTNFDLLSKLMKEIEQIFKNKGNNPESPKFNQETKIYETSEIVGVLIETLNSFEQEFAVIFENNLINGKSNNELIYQNFQKNEKNNENDVFIENLRKENIEMKYELQNSTQQIQELEIEIIGLNDQISTLTKQVENYKNYQNGINEKEEIFVEKIEKLEKELKDKEETHMIEMGSLQEKYNLSLEKKQNEIADLNKSKQMLQQFELKIQDLMKELNNKNSVISQISLKNKGLCGKIQTIKRTFYKLFYERISTFKVELNFIKRNFQEFIFDIMNNLKRNLPQFVKKFINDKKILEAEYDNALNNQMNELQRKNKKNKTRIRGLKKELALANEFKYQPPEETLNLMQSKLISEIEDRKSLYTQNFLKETNFFKKAFLCLDKGIQTEENADSIYLNESSNKVEEQNIYVNKEIANLSNNMSSLEQDYKTFINLYTQSLRQNNSKNVLSESKMLQHIEKIYLKIEENTKKDEKINQLISKLGDRSYRLDEEKSVRYERLNKTEMEKENGFEMLKVLKLEQENNLLAKELDKLRKKIMIKENKLKEKNENIIRLEKEKIATMSECKDLQVALHLKNTQYQIILNKNKNIYQHNDNDSEIMRSPLTERIAKKMSLHQVIPLEEKEMNHSNKDTLNSIKKIFLNKKI